jgi:hypothetical protein
MVTTQIKQWSITPKRENNGPQHLKEKTMVTTQIKQWSTTPKRENNGPQHLKRKQWSQHR